MLATTPYPIVEDSSSSLRFEAAGLETASQGPEGEMNFNWQADSSMVHLVSPGLPTPVLSAANY